MVSYPSVPPPPDRVGTEAAVGASSADVADRFRRAVDNALTEHPHRAELLPTRLSMAAAETLDVSSAGLSVIIGDLRVPLGASSAEASLAEQLQFRTGEGPCLDGVRSHMFVVADELELESRWPQFARDLRAQTSYSAIISVPLKIASDFTAALDIYLGDADHADQISLVAAWSVGREIAAQLAQFDTDDDGSVTPGELTVAYALTNPPTRARTVVWIAIGIIMQIRSAPATDALTIIRAYAYSHDLQVDEVAARLVDRTLPSEELAG